MENWKSNLNNYYKIKTKYLVKEDNKTCLYNIGNEVIEYKNTSIYVIKKYFTKTVVI